MSTGAPPAGAQIEAARRLQDAGRGAPWTNEIVGADALVRELADGAVPAGQPPAATTAARESLGPDKLLVVDAPITAADTAATAVERVSAHLGAGADHVILGMSFATELEVAVQRLEALGAEIAPRH